jgi:hypothetical protein
MKERRYENASRGSYGSLAERMHGQITGIKVRDEIRDSFARHANAATFVHSLKPYTAFSFGRYDARARRL